MITERLLYALDNDLRVGNATLSDPKKTMFP